MVESELFDLFPKHFIDKQIEIPYSGGTITNSELFSESMELTESLCSESELRFGSCEASQIKFKIANVIIPLAGQEISVQMKLEGHHDTPFQLGKYKVFSDQPTADRRWRDIVAYDAMQDILTADVVAWYNGILPNSDFSVKMKEFRTKFLKHLGIEEADTDMVLVNDDMVIKRTIEPEQLSGKDVITAICEINGCFGHINREGKFVYIYLPQLIQGLYPANDLYPDHAPYYLPYQQETGHLYPQNPKGVPIGKNGTYISCKYEDWLVQEIKCLQFREQENQISATYGTPDKNTYIISGNFLIYHKEEAELQTIAKNIFEKITGIVYRPYTAEIQGNPCFEVGDPVRMSTKYDIVEGYVLERTMKGIQALRDTFNASGSEYYSENVNSYATSIRQVSAQTETNKRVMQEIKADLIEADEANIKELRATKAELEEVIATKATIAELNATKATLESVIATKATITELNSTKATLESLIATKATIDSLNATKAELETVIAKKIDASIVKANYMEVANYVSAGKIRADKIETNSLQVGAANITGTTNVTYVYGANYSSISYLDANGNVQTIRVMTEILTRTMKALGTA